MATFGEYFENLRRRVEKTGRTDAACRYMDDYRRSFEVESVKYAHREDTGWQAVLDIDFSIESFRTFCLAMLRAQLKQMSEEVERDNFNPDYFVWTIDSFHEFYYAMLEEAQKLGLKVDTSSGWIRAIRQEAIRSTQK